MWSHYCSECKQILYPCSVNCNISVRHQSSRWDGSIRYCVSVELVYIQTKIDTEALYVWVPRCLLWMYSDSNQKVISSGVGWSAFRAAAPALINGLLGFSRGKGQSSPFLEEVEAKGPVHGDELR